MNKTRILLSAIAASALLLIACPYETTLMSEIRQVAPTIIDTAPGEGYTCHPTGVSRQYDFPCGNIRVVMCKDKSDVKTNFGEMEWDVPANSQYARTNSNECALDARYNVLCCPANTFSYRGLDKNTGAGLGGAADGVVRWRKETCSSPGYREASGGRVVACQADKVDVLISGIGMDYANNVE